MAKEKNEQHPVINMAGNFSLFLTFFTLSWIIFSFPSTLNPSINVFVAKILLILSSFSISLFDDKSGVSKTVFSDVSIGFGLVILFISFINSYGNIFYKIFLYIILFFGLFGTYRGIFIPVSNFIFTKSNNINETLEEHSIKPSFKYSQIILNILEILAALVTVLQFIGIEHL